MQVEFDAFWYERVEEGSAYLFRWLGVPRATVLVIWNDHGPMHVECRKAGDKLLDELEARRVIIEVAKEFAQTSFSRTEPIH